MLNFISTAIVIGILSFPAYMAYCIVHCYLTATGSTWQRLVAAFRGSASIFWARLNALSISVIGIVAWVAPFLGAPGVPEQMNRWLTPDMMGLYMLVVLMGSEIARRRTLA